MACFSVSLDRTSVVFSVFVLFVPWFLALCLPMTYLELHLLAVRRIWGLLSLCLSSCCVIALLFFVVCFRFALNLLVAKFWCIALLLRVCLVWRGFRLFSYVLLLPTYFSLSCAIKLPKFFAHALCLSLVVVVASRISPCVFVLCVILIGAIFGPFPVFMVSMS